MRSAPRGYPAEVSSFALATPFAVAAAGVYGTLIVFQHREASGQSAGETSARGLFRLLRRPAWIFAVLGDLFGFVLNAVALSLGKVVYVQPFVVLMLPVALFVHRVVDGTRPRRGDYLGCLAIVGGLAVFLILIGNPHHQRVPHQSRVVVTVAAVLLGGILLTVSATRAGRRVRAALYGAVAGAFFGTIAVMIDASSDIVGGHPHPRRHGLHGLRESVDHGFDGLFGTARGLVVVASIVLLGIGGIVLTQLSFQVGALAATLPANLVVDPLFGVLLGAVLLHEYVPVDVAHLVAYVLCLALITVGGIRLAAPAVDPLPSDPAPSPHRRAR